MHILKCENCRAYTLRDVCGKCKQAAVLSRPAKFSIDDKYADYRRKAKFNMLKNRGWL